MTKQTLTTRLYSHPDSRVKVDGDSELEIQAHGWDYEVGNVVEDANGRPYQFTDVGSVVLSCVAGGGHFVFAELSPRATG